jgi:CrcB protein
MTTTQESPSPETPVPRHDSYNTADLSRPISHSFESSERKHASVASDAPYSWWANIAHMAASDRGRGMFGDNRTPSDNQLPNLPSTPQRDSTEGEHQNGEDHRDGGRYNNEHDLVSQPDDSHQGARSMSSMSVVIGISGDGADRVSEDVAQDTVHPELEEEEEESTGTRSDAPRRCLTMLYTISYLVLFSILGALARVGLQALTTYASAPVHAASVWSNFAGCLVMGYLTEDRVLFYIRDLDTIRYDDVDEKNKAHATWKKAMPLYMGLTTGFCGSLTTFSSFIRDMFLAMANDINPSPHHDAQSAGQSFMALMSILVATISLSICGFLLGRNIALGLESAATRHTRRLVPYRFIDIVAPGAALGAWSASIVLACLTSSSWPGTKVVTTLAFAPVGCLLRFILSMHLNGRWWIPIGTLTANFLGTATIAAAWIGSHMTHTVGSTMVGCILLTSGVEDGFCGCLTTVSTWVAELFVLRRGVAFLYGILSVAACFAVLTTMMAPVRWSGRYSEAVC